MIYHLRGKLIEKDFSSAVVECGGVGYFCAVSAATLASLPALGEEVSLLTHMQLREGACDLYGFSDVRERDCFRLLLTVSGVGPKGALSILSLLTPDKLALAVAAGDVKAITGAQGVGKRIAERIVVELKDKIAAGISQPGEMGSPVVPLAVGDARSEAVDALTVLGFPKSDALAAVQSLDSSLSIEELVKRSLRILSSQK